MTTMTDTSNSLPRQASLDGAYSVINVSVKFICAVIVGLIKLVTPHVFSLLGLAAFVIAAFSYGVVPGFVTLGVAFFVFEWRISS